MRLGVVFVHYHTPDLARRAVASVERELAAVAGEGVEAAIVVVDNGSDEAGRRALSGLAAEVLRPGVNLGYAGGVNAGAARLADADVLLLANPDVELLPGALGALLAAIGRGGAVAGPRFFWDRGRRLRLPPTEARDAASEALALLAPRAPGWAARARRRWRRHARRHWCATGEIASEHLSGALLAVSRAAWERVGPFDEGFRLYFEETDWLARLRRAGLPALYVPAAEVVHRFAQSAAGEPRAADWFRQSAARYAAKHHGRPRRAAMAALGRIGRRPRGRPGVGAAAGGDEATSGAADGLDPSLDLSLDLAPFGARGGLWVEVSPAGTGFPAAAEPLATPAGRWELPEEVRAGLAGSWFLRVTDEAGRELSPRRPAAGSEP